MRAYSCFIKDRRYATPVLSFIFARDAGRARELACRELMESPHAVSFELCEDGHLILMEFRAA